MYEGTAVAFMPQGPDRL